METCHLQKILGWIPARANSKGVPGKNKRVLGNQPLILHAILTAHLAACLDRIVVSTDDREIARLALGARAEVPWMRPAELATDQSPFARSGGESVVSVSSSREHPHWSKRIAEDGSLEAFLPDVLIPARRQELTPVYCLNGVLFLASVETILSKRSFYSPRTRALVISSEKEALEIDTPFDWLVAEALWAFSRAGESAGENAGESSGKSA